MTADESKPGRTPFYWIRWALLGPGVLFVFVTTGIVAALAAAATGHSPEKWIGVPCAFTWVLTAYLIAPSRRLTAATVAWLVGGALAWPLAALLSRSGSSDVVPGLPRPFIVTCAAGLAGLLAARLAEALRAAGWQQLRDLARHDASRLRTGSAPAPGNGTGGRAAGQTATAGPPRPPGASVVTVTLQTLRNMAEGKGYNMGMASGWRDSLKSSRVVRLVLVAVALYFGWHVARAVATGFVDIVQQDQRGLYMRLGRYVRTVEPGLHFRLPLVDRIQRVSVKERQAYVQHVDAMTQDNVIMKVSLQFTYEVVAPETFQLSVQNPDQIIQEFVQGKLRDLVNTITMSDVMKKRMELNTRIMEELRGREHDYGIHFKLVQIQGTYPPTEVQEAIKLRMVAEEQTVSADQQAKQKQILADASFYEAQKQTDAEKYRIEEIAKARKESIRLLFGELAGNDKLGAKYLDYMMAQELKDNSKWILSGGAVPELHMKANE